VESEDGRLSVDVRRTQARNPHIFTLVNESTRIGTEIAGFRIESVIGRGGMSVVYLAEQTRLGRKVALKVLAPELLGRDDSFRERFIRESHMAARLDHPNSIPIYDAGEADGYMYIAMRYVDGRDLGQVIEGGPLGLGRTLYIVEQVASALDTAHAHDLVHRDVKPANILLVGDSDRLYLTDFGVAKPATSGGLTRTGFFIGTPDYSSPEQIEAREVDARTDVYALGAVFYACLAGIAPYARDTEVAVLQAHLLEPPPRISERKPELPVALDGVIATAMAKAKEDRYPTCGDLVAAARAASFDRTSTPIPAAETVLSSARATPPPVADNPATHSEPPPAVAAVPPSAAPPPAPPPPPAAEGAAEAGAEPSGRPSSDRRLHLLIGLLAAAVVGLGAALAVVLVTRNSSSTSIIGGTSFSVPLAASFEVPHSIGLSSGTAEITLNDTKVCWSFTLQNVNQPTFAHIHMGGAGVSGPIVIPLGLTYKPSGCTTASANTIRTILANPRGYYVNVHSVKYPDGAVRGQLASATTSTGPQTNGAQATGLAQVIAGPIFKNCRIAATPVAGAIQTAECVPPSGQSAVFFPDHLQLSIFPNASAVTAAYDAARGEAGIGVNFGQCNGTSWLGESNWFHAPEASGVPGKLAGRRFCYFDGNVAVIVWTHRKFGQATHIDFMGIAREGGSDHPSLYSWWRFWHHRLGKCITEGCVAKP